MLRFVLLTSLALLCAAPSIAQIRYARVIADKVKLREMPSLDSLVEGEVPEGTVVRVLDEKAPWLVIRTGDRVGWIHSATLEFMTPTSTRDATAPADIAPATNSRRSDPDNNPQPTTTPPSEQKSTSSTQQYIRGPRGGCYYISGSGRKVYVDRSMCN